MAGDQGSSAPSISASGRLVAFVSGANNLSVEDDDRVRSVFVRDLRRGTTTLVSRASGREGVAANRSSFRPKLSGNGRYVAFESTATNLSRADDKDVRDVFVRDLRRGSTTLVSRADGYYGSGADGHSTGPSISADGRRVSFESPAANLTGEDEDSAVNKYDVFVRDLRGARTELVSRASGRRGGAGSASAQAAISANGRYVAFDSGAGNLSREGNHAVLEVYVRDLRRRRTVLVSRASGRRGMPALGTASQPSISASGRFVAFESPAGSLSEGDRKGFDVFVRDLRKRTTRLVTRASGRYGRGANAVAECYSISSNGRYVTFETAATNLSTQDRDPTVDVFLRDLRQDTTTLVSRASGEAGPAADEDSGCPSMSAAAGAIAFESFATNLSPFDRDPIQDVFLRR